MSNKGLYPRTALDRHRDRQNTYKIISVFSWILFALIVLTLLNKGCLALLDWNDRRIDKVIVAEMYQRNGQALSAQTIERLNRMKPVKAAIAGTGADTPCQ